jgi:hypothetical protein
MCAPFDLSCHAANAVADGANSMLEILVEAIKDAIAAQLVTSVTWWVFVPSPDVSTPAQTLQQWMLPLTALIATGGILWQALLMVITRKGEPMIGVLKGLVSVALWGAIAVGGTNLLLRAGDAYSIWVLTAGLDGNIDALGGRLIALLVPGNAMIGLALLVGPIVAIAVFVQLALMFFRSGAIMILTGLLQLAAAGAFTTGTSGWLRKILSWHLTLILYKPMAATIYAIAFMIMGDEDNDLQVWLLGVGMLGMTIIALPAMMRFLSWMVGGMQSGSGGIGMLAAAGGAGMHAAASMRGVNDQARDMERRHSSSSGPSPSTGSPSGGSGAGSPSASPPSYTGPAPSTAGTGATPIAGAAGATVGGTGAAGSAGAGAGAAGAGTGAGAGAAAGAGGAAAGGAAAGGATAGAAAATGPAAPVVAGVVMAGQAVVGKAKQAADETTKDGAS